MWLGRLRTKDKHLPGVFAKETSQLLTKFLSEEQNLRTQDYSSRSH